MARHAQSSTFWAVVASASVSLALAPVACSARSAGEANTPAGRVALAAQATGPTGETAARGSAAPHRAVTVHAPMQCEVAGSPHALALYVDDFATLLVAHATTPGTPYALTMFRIAGDGVDEVGSCSCDRPVRSVYPVMSAVRTGDGPVLWCVDGQGVNLTTGVARVSLAGDAPSPAASVDVPGHPRTMDASQTGRRDFLAGLSDLAVAVGRGRLWLATSYATDGGLAVGATSASAATPDAWGQNVPLGHGRGADVACAAGRVFVTYLPQGGESTGSGPPELVSSTDGVAWSEPAPTVDEPKAHSSALAADDDIGLVLVYTAEGEDGWPLFAARSADFGETWGEPVMLTEPTVHAFRPDAMLHDGILYVAYLVLPDEPARDDDMGMLKDPVGVMALTLDPKQLTLP